MFIEGLWNEEFDILQLKDKDYPKDKKYKDGSVFKIPAIEKKHGGNLGTQGSASHNFNQLGIIRINRKEISDEEALE